MYFGTAIDQAVTDMLMNQPDWLQKFYDRWEFQMSNGKPVKILDNDEITYSHKDFDGDILEPKDFILLEGWARQLNLLPAAMTAPTDRDLINLYVTCSKAKKNPYIKITDEQFKYFNKASWLSLKRKGKILLNAFHTQFYPNITKVLSTQKRSKIEDGVTGDSIVGYIDMVLEMKGYDKPIIFDLKTSSYPYDQQQIDLSQQLTIYSAMEGGNFQTDLVGYVVLCKNIQKDVVGTCLSCGHIRNSRHKTCDNTVNGNRCNGVWQEKIVPKPQVQVMVEKKSPQQINDILLDIGNILLAMKNRIVYKNTNKCSDWYGNVCTYYDACHKNDFTGLTKKKSKGGGP